MDWLTGANEWLTMDFLGGQYRGIYGCCRVRVVFSPRGSSLLAGILFDYGGLLKKAASGVLAIFPCSGTGSTRCAQKWLQPFLLYGSWQDWTNPSTSSGHGFLNCPEAFDMQYTCWPLCP